MQPVLRILLRRSKEEGQEGSLETQGSVCVRWANANGYGALARKEYADDGVAGDDFTARHKLHALLSDVQRGDIVVCLDQTRLGREMLNCSYAVNAIVNVAGARLFYASTGQEVKASNAIEQFMVYAQGFSSQQEKEHNQQRTKETLREKVRKGEIAGGRCYGYENVQSPAVDTRGKGRMNTRAVINQTEAAVVCRIFNMYLDGFGLTRITKALNSDRVPSPSAGSRGTGSWSPGSIREMLRRERYVGMYVHGVTTRTRKGGKRVATKADKADIIRVEMPDWRIIKETTWTAVQRRIEKQAQKYPGGSSGPATKYPLAGLAKCAHCGGSITISNTKRSGGVRIRAYTCSWHAKRGSEVCPVKIRQDRVEVEDAMADYLQRVVLTPAIIDAAIEEVRAAVERQLEEAPTDTSAIEAELTQLRLERKRYSKAVAMMDDIPDLAIELRVRQDRIKVLEDDLAATKCTPQMLADMMGKVEKSTRAKMEEMRATLATDPSGAGEVYRALFPEGLKFSPIQKGTRRVWEIRGIARLGGCTLDRDPTGI